MENIQAIEVVIGGERIRHEVNGERIVLGRAVSCDLTLADPSISRRHAEISFEHEVCTLRDLDSSNGTRLNGAVVDGPVTVKADDRVTLAAIDLTFVTDGTASPTNERELTLTDMDIHHTTGAEISWQDLAAWRSDQASHRDKLLRMMLEASEMVHSNSDPESLYEPVLDLVERAFAPDCALVVLAEDPDATPSIVADRFTDLVTDPSAVVLSRRIVRRVLEEKVALLVEDTAASGDTVFATVVEQGVRTALAVPLMEDERVVGMIWADSRRHSVHYDSDDLKAFTLLAGVFGHALTQARLNARSKELGRLEAELDTARGILATILPNKLPKVPGYELCAHIDSCFEVGGDLYQLRNMPDGRLLVVTGDVSGKGLGAALLVATILPVLGVVCETICDPLAIVHGLNRHIWQFTDTSHFATLFLGVLEPETGHLCYVNAGHNPPYLLGEDGSLRALDTTGMPVGMFEDPPYHVAEAIIAPGTNFVLYSDGVSEAESGDALYGEGRFASRLVKNAGVSAPELMAEALCDLTEFLAGSEPEDDVTLVMIRRLPIDAEAD